MLALDLPRRVTPECLDDLAADDPRARRSRADLRRLHRVLATASTLQRGLDRATARFRPRRLLEIGAGDGSLMLRLAQRHCTRWPAVQVTLLDRLALVGPQTLEGLRSLGWTPRVVTTDVFDWLERPVETRFDVVLANLFVHHFGPAELARLLAGVAARTRVFLCCEPRRTRLSLAGSHLIGLIGAGPVTRQDAVASVHAGFRNRELSEHWPDPQDWILDDYPAGLFSHAFLAMRREA
jgi:hypothetical protein